MAETCPNSLGVGQKPDRSEATSLVGAWNKEGVETQHLQPPLLCCRNVGACPSIHCSHKRKAKRALHTDGCQLKMSKDATANSVATHKDVILASPMLILV